MELILVVDGVEIARLSNELEIAMKKLMNGNINGSGKRQNRPIFPAIKMTCYRAI